MLPFQVPPSLLEQMRDQAELTMRDEVRIYEILYSYNRYGNQVQVSGLYHLTSGLLAEPTEKNWTRIRYLLDEKIAPNDINLEQIRLLLLPYDTPEISREYVIHAREVDWRILKLDDGVTDEYQLYRRLLISRRAYPTQSEIIL